MTGPQADTLTLRPATERDLTSLARVHRAAYGPGHFLALLSEATLAEYYRLFLVGESRAVVAEMAGDAAGSGGVAGFAVFGADIERRIEQFKREQRAAIVRAALAHPVVAAQKVAQRIFGGGVHTPHSPANWLLLSIAVSGARRGVGSALLLEMLRQAAEASEPRLGLYVRHSNFGAVNAYLRAGFRIVASLGDQYYMEIDVPQSLPPIHR